MKYTLLFALLIVPMTVSGQTYTGFHLNFAGGIGLPTGERSKNGYLIAVEPKFGISRVVDIGLRYEAMTGTRGFEDGRYINVGTDIQTVHSLGLIGNVTVINKGGIRPFIGAGLGIFFIPSATVGTISAFATYGVDNSGTFVGGIIRAGFKASRFGLGTEYNLVPATNPSLRGGSGVSGSAGLLILNSYIGVKLGIDIGGKKI